jgi:hypothetical protein
VIAVVADNARGQFQLVLSKVAGIDPAQRNLSIEFVVSV